MYNLFKCYIEESSWMICTSSCIEYIWAKTLDEAKVKYCALNNFRKNKKGLKIEQIEYKSFKPVIRKVNKRITEKQIPFLGGYKYEVETCKPIEFCGNCNNELSPYDKWCKKCDCEIIR